MILPTHAFSVHVALADASTVRTLVRTLRLAGYGRGRFQANRTYAAIVLDTQDTAFRLYRPAGGRFEHVYLFIDKWIFTPLTTANWSFAPKRLTPSACVHRSA
jgi:hypothetical protein